MKNPLFGLTNLDNLNTVKINVSNLNRVKMVDHAREISNMCLCFISVYFPSDDNQFFLVNTITYYWKYLSISLL
jgi:hypothetical protein